MAWAGPGWSRGAPQGFLGGPLGVSRGGAGGSWGVVLGGSGDAWGTLRGEEGVFGRSWDVLGAVSNMCLSDLNYEFEG